jgi:hypothetical protein
MSALEVAIRKQMKKALTEESLPAVMAVIKIVIDHGLVAPRPRGPKAASSLSPSGSPTTISTASSPSTKIAA